MSDTGRPLLGTADIVGVEQLLARYGHAVDDVDPQMVREIFTVDGVFDARPCEAGIYSGIEEIVAYFALGKPPHPPSHHTTNVYVFEQDGEVRALSKFLAIDPDTGVPISGDYADRVVYVDGAWRIRHRLVTPRFMDLSFAAKTRLDRPHPPS